MSLHLKFRKYLEKFSIHNLDLIISLGWSDIRLRYRRSILGPWWLTIGMAINIVIIGLIFGKIFNVSLGYYLPYVAIGIVLWNFIVGCITEGCLSFISADAIIKQLPIPLLTHILRVFWRNIVILGHSLLILPFVFFFAGSNLSWNILYAIPGIIILLINILWIIISLSILSTRYRDLPQIITSILQVFFYVTPIMWMPELLESKKYLAILNFNPLFHLIQIVRNPLLGQHVPQESWVISIAFVFVGTIASQFLYSRYSKRIAFWL
jgi:ABC-type polysaccharide/polyol phosphate export permease